MKKHLLFIALIILAITSCKKDLVQNAPYVNPGGVSQNKISGFVQKGPFSVGSTITLQELLPSLSPTGRVFESQIKDNRGTFQLTNIFQMLFVNINKYSLPVFYHAELFPGHFFYIIIAV